VTCRACGAALPRGALFCGRCGRSVRATGAPAVPAGSDHLDALLPRASGIVEAPATLAALLPDLDEDELPAAEFPPCPQCGAPRDPAAVFCPECGAVSGGDTVAVEPVAVEPVPPVEPVAVETAVPPVDPVAALAPDAAAEQPVPTPAVALDRRIPGPATFVLQFSTGESVLVRGTGIVGRNPVSQPSEVFDDYVVIVDGSKSVSKTHLEFGQEEGAFWVSDRYSTNGSVIRPVRGEPQRCEPGRRYRVERGTRVDIGDQFFVVS